MNYLCLRPLKVKHNNYNNYVALIMSNVIVDKKLSKDNVYMKEQQMVFDELLKILEF